MRVPPKKSSTPASQHHVSCRDPSQQEDSTALLLLSINTLHLMYLSKVLCLILPGVAYAFSGGWTPLGYSKLPCSSSRAGSRFGPDAAQSTLPGRAAAPRVLRAQPNEYEVFFNNASKLGGAAISGLTPEERAERALEVSRMMSFDTTLRLDVERKQNKNSQNRVICRRVVWCGMWHVRIAKAASTRRIVLPRATPTCRVLYECTSTYWCSSTYP